jgi:hypothetical protein
MEEEVLVAEAPASKRNRRATGQSDSQPQRLAEVTADGFERLPLPLPEFGRVLGGGIYLPNRQAPIEIDDGSLRALSFSTADKPKQCIWPVLKSKNSARLLASKVPSPFATSRPASFTNRPMSPMGTGSAFASASRFWAVARSNNNFFLGNNNACRKFQDLR